MTNVVGGREPESVLSCLSNMTADVARIESSEFETRLKSLQQEMARRNVDAVYLHGGTNLYYFTGLRWHPSERMVSAIVTPDNLVYVAPHFELDTLRDFWLIEGKILSWQEHESPYQLVADYLKEAGIDSGHLLIDEVTHPFSSLTDSGKVAWTLSLNTRSR